MKHIIYKTIHKNGKYYIGSHSTNNIDDGYMGSGRWVRQIKDKSSLRREILEYAEDEHTKRELEGKYLAEHYGKPGCMNMTPDPIGFNTANNPMKDPLISAKISGDNHWSHKEPERYKEKFSGDNHWMNKDPVAKARFIEDNPNLDGRNSTLATARGNNIFQTNNPSIWRAEQGIHHWQGGNAPNTDGKLNKKLVAEGRHNFLGSAHNLKRVADGTNPFCGSSGNRKMLENGTHPSQKKKTCKHCGKEVSIGMHTRWHGDNCKKKKKQND